MRKTNETRHPRFGAPSSINVREENHPAVVKAILALYDLLDAASDIQEDHGPSCGCPQCVELNGMRYTVELYLGCLQSQAKRSPAIAQREERQKVRTLSISGRS